ncbi:hypothetical protein [Nocardioides pantholopis]|uniref:hypothetical protein n=1 Tax=Nocardioides pantholopis TaxID=2483798 RepID=UPI000FDABE44|nr:hypothetical protein [Nocardioides pantholopis]
MSARTWHDGTPTDLSGAAWNRLVPDFLGVGFRLRIAAGAEALAHAEAGARRVAQVVGARFDPVPWADLASGSGPVEVVGGWERHLVHGLGAPWTRVTTVSLQPDRATAARTLPWPWPESPTAGLPTISRLADTQAERELDRSGHGLGLWLDGSGAVRAGTAGTPVVRLADGTWVRAAGGPWPGWPVLALPAAVISPDVLAATTALAAVSDLGEVVLARSLDGRALAGSALGTGSLRAALRRAD